VYNLQQVIAQNIGNILVLLKLFKNIFVFAVKVILHRFYLGKSRVYSSHRIVTICIPPRWPYGWRACLVWEIESSNPKDRPILHRLQAVGHRFNIYYAGNCVALALWRDDGHCKLVTCFGVIRRV